MTRRNRNFAAVCHSQPWRPPRRIQAGLKAERLLFFYAIIITIFLSEIMSHFILGRYYTIFHDHLEVDLRILFEKSTGPLLRAVLLGNDLVKKFFDAVLIAVDVQIAEQRFQ